MFVPKNKDDQKAQKAAQRKALADVKNWALSCVPEKLQKGLIVDVSEVVCGDPTCAPVDTVFTLIWAEGGRGVFAVPMSAKELTQEDVIDHMPDDDILEDWKNGVESHWPRRPKLRFDIGARVECRIGPHPVKGWAPGRVCKLFYRESSWPPNMFAPYQIALHDGRLIFAPQDVDSVIRLRPPPADDAPSSPEFVLNEEEDVEDNFDDEEDEEDEGGKAESDNESMDDDDGAQGRCC